jgi:putative membrane protein
MVVYCVLMPFRHVPPSTVLLGWYALLWGVLAVSPTDWQNWMLSSVIPAIVVGALVAGRRALPMTSASYVMVGAFLTLHTVGAHYTYARMPLGHELALLLGSDRNDYDRAVHFAFGLLLATPIRDGFARLTNARGVLLYYLPVMTIVGLSGLWEILEAWVAQIVSPELGAAYLGSQGDIWDSQKDMAAALYGALLWLAVNLWARRRRAAVDSDVTRYEPEETMSRAARR